MITIRTRIHELNYSTVLDILKDCRRWSEQDYVAAHIWRYIDILKLIECLPVRNQKVLDVGIGPGHLALLIKRFFGYDIASVDIEDWRDPKAKEVTSFKRCDLETESIPYNDSFSLVIFADVIEHLPNPTKSLKQIFSRLRNGGHLLLTTPNFARLSNRIALLIGRNVQCPLDHRYHPDYDPYQRHIYEYTCDELRTLLKKCGFKIKMTYYSDCWDKYKLQNISIRQVISKIIFEKIPGIVPSLRGCIMILAEKEQQEDEMTSNDVTCLDNAQGLVKP